jgi:hypothetical protein
MTGTPGLELFLNKFTVDQLMVALKDQPTLLAVFVFTALRIVTRMTSLLIEPGTRERMAPSSCRQVQPIVPRIKYL